MARRRPSEAPAGHGDRLNPKYTFEQFVIGPGNRFAHAAALAVAELPGHSYNPLFLHGSPGIGKTHLLHAIGNYVERFGSGLQVRYATIEEFTSEFVEAVRRKQTADFKQRFRGADVVLIDDVQFLAGRDKTREEFFHTFNSLIDAGRQLVMTSDRAPEDIPGIEARLIERFGSGLVAEVDTPEVEVRMAILAKRARARRHPGRPRRARRDREPRDHQRPRARGRADPRRGVRVHARASRPRPSSPGTCCAGSAPTRRPTCAASTRSSRRPHRSSASTSTRPEGQQPPAGPWPARGTWPCTSPRS